MAVTRDDVRRTAALARLRFSDDEEAALTDDLNRILDFVEQLGEVDTAGVPPMTHALGLRSPLRADEVEARIDRDDALRSVPDTDGAFVRVPSAIE